MRPRILLLDEPHPKARAIMEEVAELIIEEQIKWKYIQFDFVYTQLTPVQTEKIVFCPCTGIDHIHAPKITYLDDQWKANEGREITSTAEHTWSLILQLAKFNRMQLRDKMLGVIGMGRIGAQITRYAWGFGTKTQGCDIIVEGKNMLVLHKSEAGVFALAMSKIELDELLKTSDIITLHVPLNDSTRELIGEKEFALMKPGALLVNTSRAEIVDRNALVDALQNKKISGYADDFYDGKKLTYDDEGLNAIRTSHIAGNCLEAREATDCYIANKIVEYIKESL
jgi:phosphoglycerate dehydrogenase-like enzyme